MGRFLNKDPLGEAGGLNRYAYALNDPVNRTDYRGLCYTGPVGLTGWRYSHSDASIIDVSIITDANYVLDSILPGGLSTGGDLPYDVLAVDENGNALVAVTDQERFDNLVRDWEAANPGSNAVVPRDQWSGTYNSDGSYSFQVSGPAPWEGGTPWNAAGQGQIAQGGQSGGGSVVGNALRKVPLVGGLLGGVGDAVSGVGNMAIGNFGRGFSQLGQGIGGAAMGMLDLAGKTWALPNTAVGLAYGGTGMLFGARPVWDGQSAILRFVDMPKWLMPSAMSLGHVQVYGPGSYQNPDGSFALNRFGVPVVAEETLHTRQAELLGPLYLPFHIFSMGGSIMTGGGTHNNNLLEMGPERGAGPWPWNL